MGKTSSNAENIKRKNKLLTAGLASILCLQFGIIFYSASTVSRNVKASSISYGETIAENQIMAINEYIDFQEERLIDYAESPEIKNFLKLESSNHSSDESFDKQYSLSQSAVQKYIENISHTREKDGNDEGIYVANLNSKVLAHSYSDNIGAVMREGKSLTKLINMINNMGASGKNKAYNAGIIPSPVGTHEQIISMYKGVFDENNANVLLGYVGMGVYIDNIENDLELEINGLPSLKYSMVHIDKEGHDTWLFNEENPDIMKTTTDENGQETVEYKEINNDYIEQFCVNYRKNPDNISVTDYYEDKNSNTVNIIAFSKKYDMLLNLSIDKNELYSVCKKTGYTTGISMLLTIIISIMIFVINRLMLKAANRLNKAVKKQEHTVEALNESLDEDLLTGVKSRGAFYNFIDDYKLDKLRHTDRHLNADETYFFVLHNINDMLQYNVELGEEDTDDLLCNICDELIQFYGKENVFRTGNKEFVCIKKEKTANIRSAIARITGMHNALIQPHKLFDNSVVTPAVDTAIIKQSHDFNVHIITELKTLALSNRPCRVPLPFIDKT